MMIEPVFRGCTRPPLLLGVPLVPMVLAIAPITLAAVWLSMVIGIYAWVWALSVTLPLIWVLRRITAIDDQRLLQVILLLNALIVQGSFDVFAPRLYSPFDRGPVSE
jgi:type IV secretory pathway VirB3-like protein